MAHPPAQISQILNPENTDNEHLITGTYYNKDLGLKKISGDELNEHYSYLN